MPCQFCPRQTTNKLNRTSTTPQLSTSAIPSTGCAQVCSGRLSSGAASRRPSNLHPLALGDGVSRCIYARRSICLRRPFGRDTPRRTRWYPYSCTTAPPAPILSNQPILSSACEPCRVDAIKGIGPATPSRTRPSFSGCVVHWGGLGLQSVFPVARPDTVMQYIWWCGSGQPLRTPAVSV